jgi:hypothetical protein
VIFTLEVSELHCNNGCAPSPEEMLKAPSFKVLTIYTNYFDNERTLDFAHAAYLGVSYNSQSEH